MQPIDGQSDYIAETGFAPMPVFGGDPAEYFVPSTAGQRFFDVIYLMDESRDTLSRPAISS
jgi:hypothetical protein